MLRLSQIKLLALAALLPLAGAQAESARGTINVQLGNGARAEKVRVFYIRSVQSASAEVVSRDGARLRGGVASAPGNAPDCVKAAIKAVNGIRTCPYRMGGGHGSFDDSAYDCSGTVSFALHHAGVLAAPMASGDLANYGEPGRGKWITIYSRNGHAFAVIAGLRLDTTQFGRGGGNIGPRWHDDGRDLSGFEARHPAGL